MILKFRGKTLLPRKKKKIVILKGKVAWDKIQDWRDVRSFNWSEARPHTWNEVEK